MRFEKLLADSRRRLAKSGFRDSLLHISLLAEKAFGPEYAFSEEEPGIHEISRYEALERRLVQGEPLDYIVGSRSFHRLSLKVDRRALIPRNETEELVEVVLNECSDEELVFADIGTGTGAIALAIADSRPRSRVYASDISESALELARENAELNDISNVRFLQGSVLAPFGALIDELDVIVTNPPYILTGLIHLLEESVKDHEPLEALDGGPDGLSFYRRLTEQLPSGKTVYTEITGYGRDGLIELVERNCPDYSLEFANDSGGRPRFAVLRSAT